MRKLLLSVLLFVTFTGYAQQEPILVETCVAKIMANKFKKEDGQLEIERQAKHYKLVTGLYIFLHQ